MSKRTEKLLIWTFGWSMGWFGAIFFTIMLTTLMVPEGHSTFERGSGLWLMVILMYSSPVLGIVTAWFWLRKRDPDFAKYPLGHCQSCGYDLTGNQSGRCSECGAVLAHKERMNGLPPGP